VPIRATQLKCGTQPTCCDTYRRARARARTHARTQSLPSSGVAAQPPHARSAPVPRRFGPDRAPDRGAAVPRPLLRTRGPAGPAGAGAAAAARGLAEAGRRDAGGGPEGAKQPVLAEGGVWKTEVGGRGFISTSCMRNCTCAIVYR
jgi:hypothetical protein